MASSLFLPGLYAFYPVGNTTSLSLTRDLPPDVPANILLLPCGDPRNILYTSSSLPVRKELDFTCCDYDPGVLARNILLLTMIMDCSQKLAAYDSVEAWRSSPFGAIIKIGTDHTFAELRRHWELYADFYHPSKLPRFRELQAVMDKKLKEIAATCPKDNLNPLVSAGPLFAQSRESGLLSEQHLHYWETGTTFTDKRNLAASIHPNSTFLYSRAGEGFDVNPATDPMVPFHHAPLFGNMNQTLTIADLVESATSQFRAWTSAFQIAATPGKGSALRVVVRFLLGDALAIARGLRDFSENTSIRTEPLTALTVGPWTTPRLELNREEYANLGAPTRFDVIDTSNVADYLGLLNIFLAISLLLTSSPSSVLYTESMMLFAPDLRTEFEATMFASLSAVAILMDLAPVNALSGFTSRCEMHDLICTFVYSKDKDTHQQKFTWKRPSSGDPSASPGGGPRTPVHFDTPQLVKLLHNIYVDMFQYGDPTHLETRIKTMKPEDLKREIQRPLYLCSSHEAFVIFLEFIRTSLPISKEQWFDIMRSFQVIPHSPARHPELHAQLLRYGLYTLSGTLDEAYGAHEASKHKVGRLSRWKNLHILVRVFLLVPRAQLTKPESIVTAIGLPGVWLHCYIKLPHGSYVFHSVDAAYGTLVDAGTAAEPDVSFREDPDGRKNGADLVVSFVVVVGVLLGLLTGKQTPPGDIFVELCIRGDPMIVAIPPLASSLCVFRACLEDTNYVHLVPEQPLSPRLPATPDSETPVPSRLHESTDTIAIGRQQPVRVEMDTEGKHVVSLTAKLEIMNTTVQAAFAKGAMPDVSQCSPCAIQVVLGGHVQKLAYPLPIVGSQRKLRLARKSSYIEVVVPVAISFLQPDGLKVNPFPVVGANGSLFPWSFHRVVLDQLPVLNVGRIDTARLKQWYDVHLISQLSQRNGDAALNPANPDVLANIKWTIKFIMERAAGVEGGKLVREFALLDSSSGMPGLMVDTILFVDKVRYDVSAHAMVCDAFVVTTCRESSSSLASAMADLFKRGFLPANVPTAATMRAWKQMLPALAERCRTTWTHGVNCEYGAQGKIPLVLGTSEGDPLCSCGRGKDVEGMMKDRVWQKFARLATRIALSPLFPVPYLEDVFAPEDLRRAQGASTSTSSESVHSVGHAAPSPAHFNGSNGNETTSASAAVPLLGAAQCDRCKKKESADLKLLVCSRCKEAAYCSRECQKSDWKTHKLRCHN
ncbi:hypothetical protein V8D89_002515 [Ganoderma adspersum]